MLNSRMHMAWVKYIGGRLKSDFRYSNEIVYNNFPFPIPTEKQKAKIETCAQKVLEARAMYPNSSLAELYDKTLTPAPLTEAHNALDKAVDACYSKIVFATELERIEFLFQQYEAIVASLFVKEEEKTEA
jgi:hypothetical protein